MRIDTERLRAFITGNIHRLCEHFYPDGTFRDGHEWRCGDVYGKPGNSFAIELKGPKAGLCNDRDGSFSGDFIKALCTKLNVKYPDAVAVIELAMGVSFRIDHYEGHRNSKNGASFNWDNYVNGVTEEDLHELANWRGYSPEFCRWLRDRKLIGRFQDQWAFPVQENGKVVATHYRNVADNGEVRWHYAPKLTNGVQPFVLGRLKCAQTVHCSESQWDMLSLADKLRLDQSIGVVTFSTRGAGNAKLLSCIPKDAGAVFLWPQNDEAGRRWLQRAIEVLADRHPRTVRIPDGVKDLNDWVKAGATGQDIQSAIDSARIAEPADAIDPGTDSNTTDAQDQSRKQRPNKEESDEHATEHQLVERLKQQLPPLRCVASAWYTYENGAWRRGTIDIYRPQALAIQNARNRSQHRATSVLNHLESTAQVNEEEFSSFYKFDGEAILINCANGVLRVTAGTEKLLPHSPGYLFTGQVAANFDRDAIAPIFEKILQEALPDPEDLTLFKLFAGYILYPACSFEAALVCYGDGGTGKSTIAGGIRAALGADLVKSLTLLQICDPKSFHLVNLRNAAVNLSAELDALPVKGAENFKLLVSGEQVSADRKYQDLVSLNTECKFLFLTNYLPRFQHGTDAELRRLRFLRFERKPAKPDPRLKQQVALEADGIFRLMVDGLRTLLVQQEIPQGGKQSSGTRERFKIQNDPVSAFVNSCCRINPKAEELKSVLYDEYKEFLEANGIPAPQESSTFFRALYNRFQIKDIKRRDAGKLIPKIAGIELLPDE